MIKKHSNSSFWLDDNFFSKDIGILGEVKRIGPDPIKLAGYRRAIGNFVRIVTGQAIPVRFVTKGSSYTDGKSVTISASLKDKDFDPAVGLALHEGSHIKLTDFEILPKLGDWIQKHDEVVNKLAEKHQKAIADRWAVNNYVMPILKDILNIVEDRRIDNFIYTSAPGYKGYYQALYDKYFNARIIDKGLISPEYRTEDWESYMFRLCNITNPNRDLDALKSLREIWKVLDLKHINRLNSTQDSLDVAWDIFNIIEENVPALPDPVEQEGDGDGEGEEGEGGDGSGGEAKTPEGDAESDDGSTAEGDDAKVSTGGEHKGNAKKPDELTDKQKEALKKAIKKQKEFHEGEIKKTSVSKKMNQQMQSMESAGVSTVDVEFENENSWDGGAVKNVNVTVIRNFNRDLVNNVDCGMWDEWRVSDRAEWVKEGMKRGVMLGKKLKVRAEEKSTKFNRLRTGKIDKKRIASAGYGAEAIFERLETFAYNPGIIHLSIDNSGSMAGGRLEKSVITATAIAKACSMIENMDCVISFRAGSEMNRDDQPIILYAYDSRMHGMSQLRTMLPYVCTSGSTPEGLCFDAIMKDIIDSSRGKDAYFVNFSDGAPYYNSYHGESAYKHTRKQVKKMTREGIKVISYFISGMYDNGSANDAFTAMYGKEASFINVNKIGDVAKTMNKKFLEVKN